MFNDKLMTWQFDPDVIPDLNRPLFILVENDVVSDPGFPEDPEDIPFTRSAMLVPGELTLRWKLLDFDPETEEEYLHGYFSVVAWRYK